MTGPKNVLPNRARYATGPKLPCLKQREKDVFYQASEFKMRVINLAAGESIPKCDMASHVVFVCIKGQGRSKHGGRYKGSISCGDGLITESATLSMSITSGVRVLRIQIAQGSRE